MQKNKQNKKSKKDFSLIFKYLPCFFVGVISTLLGILVLALAYYKLSLNSEFTYYFTYIFISFGAFLTGYSTYKKFKNRGIVSGALGAVPLLVFNLIFILIFSFKSVNAFVLLVIPITVLFGSIGGIVSSNSKKRY